MEQVIFLHADEDSEETLSQIQRSLAQRLVLVAPAHMDRLRLSLLLRLARRYIGARARYLCLISEDPLAQMLAARMGFAVAATLDEYRGLMPRPAPSSSKRRRRSSARLPRSSLLPVQDPPAKSDSLPAALAPFGISRGQAASQTEKPAANLEKMLVDGFLPNPAATPDLEEQEEQAAREEQERLYYEIADELPPSQAQQDAERHEEQITTRILKTSQRGASDQEPPALPPQSPTDQVSGDAPAMKNWEGSLRPMPTIDELLRERGRGEVFDWFEHQAAEAAAAIAGGPRAIGEAKTAVETLPRPGAAADPSTPGTRQPTAPGGHGRWPRLRARAGTPARQEKRGQKHPAGAGIWRRMGIMGVLALSVLMTGAAVALIPYAQVDYQQEISPYSETLLLAARPAGLSLQPAGQPDALAQAKEARFDGVAAAQALATGQRASPDAPDHLVHFPTQEDVDLAAEHLHALAQQWGEQTLRAQAHQEDILGPIITEEETRIFPPVGTDLPAGVTHFQVSLALHLRATLIRHAALLQAVQQQLRKDVNRVKPGFAPQPDSLPQVSILDTEPAGPGEAQLALLVRVQVHALIGPALTPDQARKAIAGKDIAEAHTYLAHWPGITNVSISVQPNWLNRLPIVSARIGITVVSSRQDTAQMA